MGCGAAMSGDYSGLDLALVIEARKAMANAYAPYSRFAVGAAVELDNGTIVRGCNLENASYGLALCAEAGALSTVNAHGGFARIRAIAIAGGPMDADPNMPSAIVTPCGRCRQLIREARDVGRDRGQADIRIICAGAHGQDHRVYSIDTLLPDAFGPANLK